MADMLKASWEELKTVADAAYRAENYKRAFDLYTTILDKHKDELGHDDALQIRGNRGLASQKQGDRSIQCHGMLARLHSGIHGLRLSTKLRCLSYERSDLVGAYFRT